MAILHSRIITGPRMFSDERARHNFERSSSESNDIKRPDSPGSNPFGDATAVPFAHNFQPRKRCGFACAAGREFEATARVDTPFDVAYYQNGGILHHVLRQMRA
jgi:hypothetical protein